MSQLAYTRLGAGAPLVLLHGIGLSRRSWDPVLAPLAEHFEVVAVDLPGHGDAEPLPSEVEPQPAALAAAVQDLLDELGVVTPHVAGNSLGGWVALELARITPVASLTLLSPAGLWRRNTPAYCRASLRVSRWLARHASGALTRLVRYRVGRVLALGHIHGRAARVTPEYARGEIQDMGTSSGFDAVLAATARRRWATDSATRAPVTVAFGSRDLLLLPYQSRHLDQLPPGTHVDTLPACGHIPMSDDPRAVVALISRGTARAGREPAVDTADDPPD